MLFIMLFYKYFLIVHCYEIKKENFTSPKISIHAVISISVCPAYFTKVYAIDTFLSKQTSGIKNGTSDCTTVPVS